MSYETEVELDAYESGEPVTAIIHYETHEEYDFCPHGEHGTWVGGKYPEILREEFFKDGKKYEPTKDDYKSWKRAIQNAASSALIREVA